jgi:hypothetical protein
MTRELPPLNEELSFYADNSQLLSETLQQLRKDLGENWPDDHEPGQMVLSDLIGLVADVLYEVNRRSQQTLFNLFYRIDLPETKVQESLNSDGFDWNALAELIFKRELQKVVLRRHFSR